jgi:hypothetical protein
MNILELLSSNSYLTVNKALAKKVGLEAAVLFADLAGSQLHWNNQKNIEVSDWFFRTREQIEEQTTLSSKTQLRCAKILIEAGLIQTKLKGLPAVTHYLIGEQEVTNLLNMIGKKGAARYSQTEQLETPKRSTIKNININNKTINNININKESKKDFTLIFPQEFSPQLIKKVTDFIEYRSEIKKPFKSNKSITQKIENFLKELKQYGEQIVIASIDNAIANGWQGTFINKELLNNQKQNQNGIRTIESENEIRLRSAANVAQGFLNQIHEEERRRNDLEQYLSELEKSKRR